MWNCTFCPRRLPKLLLPCKSALKPASGTYYLRVTLMQIPQFTAGVIDFPQRLYAQERGLEVHGMVGMEFLEQYDFKYAKVCASLTLGHCGTLSAMMLTVNALVLADISLPCANRPLARANP